MTSEAAVNEAVLVTFEEMAFLDVLPGPAPEPEAPEEGPVLYLPYSKPRQGSFSLALPKAIKFQVAEAIYGEDWASLSSTQLDDSLLELMNVLAGRLLTLGFSGAAYTMGLPTILYDPIPSAPGETSVKYLFHRNQNEFNVVWSEVSP